MPRYFSEIFVLRCPFVCVVSVSGSFSDRVCPGTRSVRTGYELRMHGTLGKSSIITCVHYALTLSEEYLFVSVCADFFILLPIRSCQSL